MEELSMQKTLAALLIAGSLAVPGALATAKADVLRLAIVIAPDQAAYENNVGLTSTYEELYKKGGGTSCTVGSDPTHLAIASSCLFPNEAAIAAMTALPEWKAAYAKLKPQMVIIEVLQTGH